MKLLTIIYYPFMLVFTFIIVFTTYPLALLMYFPDGTEEGTYFDEIKEDFIKRFGTPKRFFITTWEITEQKIKE